MIDTLRKWIHARRMAHNCARATSVGEGTQLLGLVDRRASGATIVIGRDCLIQAQLVAERDESRITIGDGVSMGGGTILDCALEITVERGVIISYQCLIADSDNHSVYPELRANDVASWKDNRQQDWTVVKSQPVRICEGAWVGARSIILKGVTIGVGAVVGAGSVVTDDVPARVIVAGNPARVVRPIGPAPESGA